MRVKPTYLVGPDITKIDSVCIQCSCIFSFKYMEVLMCTVYVFMLNTFLRFEVFTTEKVQITNYNVTPYNLVGCY